MGKFEPERELTDLECLTLALRLYNLQQGEDGNVRKAPEDWGKLTLTLSDQSVFSGWGEGPRGPLHWETHEGKYADGKLVYELGWVYLSLSEAGISDYYEELTAWGNSHEGPATMTLNGKTYSGQAVYTEFRWNAPVLAFCLDAGDDSPEAMTLRDALDHIPGPEIWWRDSVYALSQMEEMPALQALVSDVPAAISREDFALALACVAGELEAINSIVELPDSSDPDILRLYRAGILTGTDPYGTFRGDGTLTRGEAAAMAARVLKPQLRVRTVPTALSYWDYTLTELDLQGWELPAFSGFSSSWLPLEKDGHYAVLLQDGTILPLPPLPDEGSRLFLHAPPYGDWSTTPYVELTRYAPESSEGEYALFDVETGTFLVEYQDWELYFKNVQFLLDDPALIQWDEDIWYCIGKTASGTPIISACYEGKYYNEQRVPVTTYQAFDFAGPVGDDGMGFVFIGDKIYRIEFQ